MTVWDQLEGPDTLVTLVKQACQGLPGQLGPRLPKAVGESDGPWWRWQGQTLLLPRDRGQGPERFLHVAGDVVHASFVEDGDAAAPWAGRGQAGLAVHRTMPFLQLLQRSLGAARTGRELTPAHAVALAWAQPEGPWGAKTFFGAVRRWFAEEAKRLVPEEAPPEDVPLELGPWSYARLKVVAHPRGARLRLQGPGGVSPVWAHGGRAYEGFAVSTARSASLRVESGGPVGDWVLKSALGGVGLLGSRGVVFRFRASGRLDVVFADAFVGGIDAVDAAQQMGTSGIVKGRWSVGGVRTLRLHELSPQSVTLHGRGEQPTAFPAGESGLVQGLQAMCESPWTWRITEGWLYLDGKVFGSSIELRFQPEHPVV